MPRSQGNSREASPSRSALFRDLAYSNDVDVDRVYERRPKASMPASCNHFTIY